MANIGNLSNYLQEEGKITDYSWFQVDPSEIQNIPFNDLPAHNALPQLEEQWKHTKDNNLTFIPNYEVKAKTAPKMCNDSVLNYVSNLKKQMMLGKNGEDLKNYILDTLDPELMPYVENHLNELESEEGLLGNVYIDVTPFKNCAEAYDILNKKTKLAKYIMASNCNTCINCSSKRCSLFKKQIVASVNYDSKLLNEYKTFFKSSRNIDIELNSKEDLQNAFVTYKEGHNLYKSKIAENKPNMNDDVEVTLEDKKKQFEQDLSELKQDLNSVELKKARQSIATLMLKTSSTTEINTFVKERFSSEFIKSNKKELLELFNKIGSYGVVFIDSQYLPGTSCFDNKNLRDTAPPYLVVDAKKPFCKCMSNKCLNLNKYKVTDISEIPSSNFEVEFNKFHPIIKEKIKQVFEKDPLQGLKLCRHLAQVVKMPSNIEAVMPIISDLIIDIDKQEEIDQTQPKELTNEEIKKEIESGKVFSEILNNCEEKQIKDCLNDLKSIYKYQNDIDLKLPKNLSVKKSNKDVKYKINLSSVNAPIDSDLYNLRARDMLVDLEDIKKISQIEIEDFNEFII